MTSVIESEKRMLSLIFLLAVAFRSTDSLTCSLYAPGFNVFQAFPDVRNFTQFQCMEISVDGKTFDTVLDNPSPYIFDRYPNKSLTLDQVTPWISSLSIEGKLENLTLTKSSLSKLKKLQKLTIRGWAPGPGNLAIEPDALGQLQNLDTVDISLMNFTSSAFLAFDGVSNQLTAVSISNVLPEGEVLKELSKFKNLNSLDLSRLSAGGPAFETTLQNMATNLKRLSINYCRIQRITPNMFKGMYNLTFLSIEHCDVLEIDSGAFEDLKNLVELHLNNNQLDLLPDGLFNKNENLEYVFTYGNTIGNISPANFTHCKNFKGLRSLKLPELGPGPQLPPTVVGHVAS